MNRRASFAARGLLALSALTACASSRPPASKADVAKPVEAVASAAATAAPSLPEVATPALPGGAKLPGPFSPPGGLPLVAPGEARTTTEGCLTLANPEQEGPSKAPAVENTRGGADGPEVAVKQTPAGITVTHGLHHNCCQKADVQTKIDGAKVTITETFGGPTCRCNCRSTISTTVGLKPGDYSVEVVRIDGGPAKSVYSGSVSIKSLLGPK